MMLAVTIFLVLLGKSQANQNDNLELLLEQNDMEISMVLDSIRLSLLIPMNSTETMRKEPFARIRSLKNTWINYEAFKTPTIGLEFKNSLDMAEKDFRMAGEASKYLYSLLNQDKSVQPKTSCQLLLNILDWSELDSDSQQLMNLQEKIVAATPQDVQDNYDRLYNLIALYSETALSWREKTAELLEYWNLLSNMIFPQDLYDQLGAAKCLQSSKFDQIKVLSCDIGLDSFICEIEVNQPKVTAVFTRMIPIRYGNLILSGPDPSLIFVKDKQTNQITSLHCPQSQPIDTPIHAPFCEINEQNRRCEQFLNIRDMDGAISSCYFRTTQDNSLAMRTIDDSVLILDDKVKIIVDGKPIFDQAPLRIYSNSSVILMMGKGEIKYLATGINTGKAIVRSKLTSSQLSRMQWNAYWLKTNEAMQAWNIVDIVLLALEIVTLPFLLTNFICNIQNRMRIAKSEKRFERRLRKSNYEENRDLLRIKSRRK
jgi:hypothetical protein